MLRVLPSGGPRGSIPVGDPEDARRIRYDLRFEGRICAECRQDQSSGSIHMNYMSTIPPSTTRSTTTSSWISMALTHGSSDIPILLPILSSMTYTSPALLPLPLTSRAATFSILNKKLSGRRYESFVRELTSFGVLGSLCQLVWLIGLSRRMSSRSTPWPLRSGSLTSLTSKRLGSMSFSRTLVWCIPSPISHGIWKR